MVDDLSGWLVTNAQAELANGEAEVDVLVVGGNVVLIEAAYRIPCRATQGQAGSRGVVDIAGI